MQGYSIAAKGWFSSLKNIAYQGFTLQYKETGYLLTSIWPFSVINQNV